MTKCVISPSKETANVVIGDIAVSKKTRKHYCLYSDNAFYESLLKFFMQDQQEPLHTFVKKENINRSTFHHFYVESGLLNLKEGGNRDEAQARLCLNAYFEKKTKNRSYRTSNATMATKYLTDNEELAIIQLCRLLGGMGYGITRDELQDIVSSITNFDLDKLMPFLSPTKLCTGFSADMMSF